MNDFSVINTVCLWSGGIQKKVFRSQSSQSGSTFLPCLGLPSKSNCEKKKILNIFAIPSSSRHKKLCQLLE